jgi:hypothetical protein
MILTDLRPYTFPFLLWVALALASTDQRRAFRVQMTLNAPIATVTLTTCYLVVWALCLYWTGLDCMLCSGPEC